MALGALIDCGVPLAALRDALSSLPVTGWAIEAQPMLQNGIHAVDVTISVDGRTDSDELRESAESEAHDQHHSHRGQPHEHSHAPHSSSEHRHEGHAHQEHAHGRSLAEIREIIESSGLSRRVKDASLSIFNRIGQAEGHIHHTEPEQVHFHEIGGLDSLLDICGVAWCLEYLGVDAVHCSALPHSTGFVDCAHGRMPVPAPATLELLKGVPWVPTEVRGEMVTPTGAGIVAALSQGFGPPPAMTPRALGVGSGKKRFPDRPNLLRVIVGEAEADQARLTGLQHETLNLVETNIDDMNPELFQYVMERLFDAGAVDVWFQPIQMKKNRPAVLLSALCSQEACAAVVTTLLCETTTLGARVSDIGRVALRRDCREVDTRFGAVRVKVAQWPERGLQRAAPEYDDVERLARQHGVPAREVYEAAVAGMRQVAGAGAGRQAATTEAL